MIEALLFIVGLLLGIFLGIFAAAHVRNEREIKAKRRGYIELGSCFYKLVPLKDSDQ